MHFPDVSTLGLKNRRKYLSLTATHAQRILQKNVNDIDTLSKKEIEFLLYFFFLSKFFIHFEAVVENEGKLF